MEEVVGSIPTRSTQSHHNLRDTNARNRAFVSRVVPQVTLTHTPLNGTMHASLGLNTQISTFFSLEPLP
jgi:hypothetical protein